MAAKLEGASGLPAQNPQMASAPLRRPISMGLLGERRQELGGEKAAGVDYAAKAGRGASLGESLNDLAERLKRKGCKPQLPLRACMPKADGKPRPPGMAACEGKLAQFALERALEAACEPKPRGRMFGFWPRPGCHGDQKEPSRLTGNGAQPGKARGEEAWLRRQSRISACAAPRPNGSTLRSRGNRAGDNADQPSARAISRLHFSAKTAPSVFLRRLRTDSPYLDWNWSRRKRGWRNLADSQGET
ncbi:MAG: hypothetical protein LBU32_12640 [Clostridiales bacterium]|jgi:hypothetical protein|nr:hypothetical protein [Clostridiales bacterium]